MRSDRKTLLERRAKASAVMNNDSLPPELRQQAKGLVDQVDSLLGLQDAQARKDQASQAVPPEANPLLQ
jgi:hypothetical protein